MDRNDPPKKENGKPSSNVLKAILENSKYMIPGIGTSLAARDLVSKVSLSRMAENLDPFSYATYGGSGRRGPIERFIDAVVLNKKEEPRAETERFIQTGAGMKPFEAFKERVDLLQMLAGKKQKYNTIEPSKYRPTKNDEEGTQYYSSKSLESKIAKELDLGNKSIKWQKDIIDMITPLASIDEKTNKPIIRKSGIVTTIPGLGQGTYSVGKDEKGVYLSYTDVWDLDPTTGASAESRSGNAKSISGLIQLGKEAAESVGTSIVNATAKPTNIYGRIYFDPKTGKPIL